MAIIKAKPTSPGRRFRVQIREELYKGRPEKTLVESKKRISGRNNNGHITVRHKGGGPVSYTHLTLPTIAVV